MPPIKYICGWVYIGQVAAISGHSLILEDGPEVFGPEDPEEDYGDVLEGMHARAVSRRNNRAYRDWFTEEEGKESIVQFQGLSVRPLSRQCSTRVRLAHVIIYPRQYCEMIVPAGHKGF
jgi:hypothetical protein